jgi:S1-C subfamily serine protease
VRIKGITGNSPADHAHIPPGYFIVRIDGMPITTNDDIALAVGAALAGREVKVEVAPTLKGPTREYRVTLAKYYVPGPFIASVRPPAIGGLRVDHASTSIKPNVASDAPLPNGVVIREVVPKSPAERAGLQLETIITKVNGRAVFTPAEYYEEVRKSTGPLELTTKRLNGEETVKVERR